MVEVKPGWMLIEKDDMHYTVIEVCDSEERLAKAIEEAKQYFVKRERMEREQENFTIDQVKLAQFNKGDMSLYSDNSYREIEIIAGLINKNYYDEDFEKVKESFL